MYFCMGKFGRYMNGTSYEKAITCVPSNAIKPTVDTSDNKDWWSCKFALRENLEIEINPPPPEPGRY